MVNPRAGGYPRSMNPFDGRDDVWVSPHEAARAFIVVPGMGGCKEDAIDFAERAAANMWQTVAMDLPAGLQPWGCVEAIREVHAQMRTRWSVVALRATSIGAWFAAVALQEFELRRALLQAPMLDMVGHIEQMMAKAGVNRVVLERADELPGPDGQPLSWRYLTWAEDHPFPRLDAQTAIIIGDGDELVGPEALADAEERLRARITTIPGAGHRLHTAEELAAVERWEVGVLRPLHPWESRDYANFCYHLPDTDAAQLNAYFNRLVQFICPTPAQAAEPEHRSSQIQARRTGRRDDELLSMDPSRMTTEAEAWFVYHLVRTGRLATALRRYPNLRTLIDPAGRPRHVPAAGAGD